MATPWTDPPAYRDTYIGNRKEFLTGQQVPEGRLIHHAPPPARFESAAREPASVQAKGHSGGPGGVESEHFFAGLRVPDSRLTSPRRPEGSACAGQAFA